VGTRLFDEDGIGCFSTRQDRTCAKQIFVAIISCIFVPYRVEWNSGVIPALAACECCQLFTSHQHWSSCCYALKWRSPVQQRITRYCREAIVDTVFTTAVVSTVEIRKRFVLILGPNSSIAPHPLPAAGCFAAVELTHLVFDRVP